MRGDLMTTWHHRGFECAGNPANSGAEVGAGGSCPAAEPNLTTKSLADDIEG